MTAIDHTMLEHVARNLCESKRGAGAWNKPKCHRNHWRKLAAVEITRARGLATADAFFGRFGFKRVQE